MALLLALATVPAAGYAQGFGQTPGGFQQQPATPYAQPGQQFGGPGPFAQPQGPGGQGPQFGQPQGPGGQGPQFGQPQSPGGQGPQFGQPQGPGGQGPQFGQPTGPGFGPQQPVGPQRPGGPGGRQNYADESTDFGVPAKAELEPNVGSPTPTSIPGARVVTTDQMRQAANSGVVVIDVLAGPPHPQIPGSLWMPGAGNAGTFDDQIQQQLWNVLSQVTQRNPDRPLAFLCAGSKCWESYNAALRASHLGFKSVLWYRGGLAAWQAAGLPMVEPGQQNPGTQTRGSGDSNRQ